MELKRNLVKDLRDKEYRDEYLHPQKRSLFDFFKIFSKDINKKFSTYYILYGISKGLVPVISAFVIREITKIVSQLLNTNVSNVDSLKPLFFATIGYSVLFFILSSIYMYLECEIIPYIFALRNKKMLNLFGKFSSMEFGLYEDSSFMSSLGNWSRAIQSNNTGYQGILQNSLLLTGDIFSAILLGILFFTVDYKMFFIVLASIIVSIYLEESFTKYQKSMLKEEIDISKRIGRISSLSSDFKYGKDVRVFRMEKSFENIFNNLLIERDALLKKYTLKRILQSPFVAIFSSIVFILGIYTLGRAFILTDISLERLVMLMTSLLLFSNTILEITKKLSFIKGESIYLDDFYDLLEVDLEPLGGEEFPENINAEIKFENVWFKYPGSENWVLKDISFTVNDKSSIALVGVNGAGKTSIVKLLTGLYQPDSGTITIGGADIRNIAQSELSKIFGIVFQDVNPPALTVAENVAVDVDNIDRNRVKAVLDRVGLLEKIESFPKGIDTPVLRVLEDDGIILSGGENQKLMIARALYRQDSKILILDEPTAALDAIAEEEIYKSFNEILKGKTGLFISHRLASTRFCDEILLLNNGTITEKGTHEELLKNNSLYSEMYETQASYYQEEYNNGE